jgi:uncharacterized protein (DUF58 family)
VNAPPQQQRPAAPLQPTTVKLRSRNIYILPTRQGWLFMAMLLVMLVGAINYASSLAYVLTFLLAGVVLVSPLHTQGNLLGLEVAVGRVTAVHAGDVVGFGLRLTAPDDRPRPGLRLLVRPGRAERQWQDPVAVGFGLRRGECADIELPWLSRRRGWLLLPAPILETRYPFGLFRAWSRLDLDLRAVIYPAPATQLLQPPGAPADSGDQSGDTVVGVDDFQGLRGYRPGDPPRRLYWRSWRPGEAPLVTQFSSGSAAHLLDYDSTRGLPDEEARLSQLCAWVLAAERAGEPCGLRLPGRLLPPTTGRAHMAGMLEALALYGLPQ